MKSLLSALAVLALFFPLFLFIAGFYRDEVLRDTRTAVLAHIQSVSTHINSQLKIYDMVLQAGRELPSFQGMENLLQGDVVRIRETRGLLLIAPDGTLAESYKNPGNASEQLIKHPDIADQFAFARPFQMGIVEIDGFSHLFLSRHYPDSRKRPELYAVLILRGLTLLSEHSLFAYPIRMMEVRDKAGGAFSVISEPGAARLSREGNSGFPDDFFYGTRINGPILYARDKLGDFPFSLNAAYNIQKEIDKTLRFRGNLFLYGYAGIAGALAAAVFLSRLIREGRRSKAELLMRATLIREIHHRIKNNLQTVSGLLNLQNMQINDPRLNEFLNVAQMRLRVISLLHEELYRRESLSEVVLRDYVESLKTAMEDLHGLADRRIAFLNEVDPSIRLDLKLSQTCGLLVHELVTNSLKHAFPAGRIGTVIVRGIREDADVCLSIEDDGVGLLEDGAKSDGIGSSLVQALVKQIRGTCTVDGDGGTRTTVRFPPQSGE